jgi:glycosyltransferase involved in cell wall biosynthesis
MFSVFDRPNRHSRRSCLRVALVSSCVDLGTSSITRSIEHALQPCSVYHFRHGFRKLSVREWLSFVRFMLCEGRKCDVIVAAFNAPILATALFSWTCPTITKRAILEWNELLDRSEQRISLFAFYNSIYLWAFRRYSALYTPSSRFADLYRKQGVVFRSFCFPLPDATPLAPKESTSPIVKVLFIGGDAKRKGGVELLEGWRSANPKNAELTFVCPKPPIIGVQGVSYLTSVRSGTPEHMALFKNHDIFILPTYWDTFGFVILEAAANGLCIITTRNAGASDVATMFGGIVLETPEQAVTALLSLVEKPDQVTQKKRLSERFLPAYKRLAQHSISNLIVRTVS